MLHYLNQNHDAHWNELLHLRMQYIIIQNMTATGL